MKFCSIKITNAITRKIEKAFKGWFKRNDKVAKPIQSDILRATIAFVIGIWRKDEKARTLDPLARFVWHGWCRARSEFRYALRPARYGPDVLQQFWRP